MSQEQDNTLHNFPGSSQAHHVYTGSAPNELQSSVFSLQTNSFEHKSDLPSDALSFQSYLTTTDLTLSDTSEQQGPLQNVSNFFQLPQQPQQPYQQQQQQPTQPTQTVIQQQQHYQPQQQQPQPPQQADFYSHFDQYNNPLVQPTPNPPSQQLPHHVPLETLSNQYSSVRDLPHLPTNFPTEPHTISQSLMQLSPQDNVLTDLPAACNRTTGATAATAAAGTKGRRTVWQEVAEEVVPMHAILFLLFIFSTAVLCILTEDCLSCIHILPCVSLLAIGTFSRMGC